jgi:SAM-dependent methyltransferase
MSELRARIYRRYATAGNEPLAPATTAGFAPRAAMLRRLIRVHLPTDHSAAILDLGCGHGALIHFVREAGYGNVQGVDVSPEQVAEARRLGIEGIRQGDLLEALRALPSLSEDAVIAFDVIEHFSKDELLPLVDEVFRVLKPGGRWIIHAPNAESPFCGAVRYGDMTHEQAFTRHSLTQLLRSSGFSRVQCYESGPVRHGLKSSLRWLAWQVIRLGMRFWSAAETGDLGRDAIYTRNLLAVAFKPSVPGPAI